MSVYAQQTYTARVVNQETEPYRGNCKFFEWRKGANRCARSLFFPLNENQTIRISYLGFTHKALIASHFATEWLSV